jgi:hypothetical protein
LRLGGSGGGAGQDARHRVADNVVVSGKPTKADLEACWNLGATVAANLSSD